MASGYWGALGSTIVGLSGGISSLWVVGVGSPDEPFEENFPRNLGVAISESDGTREQTRYPYNFADGPPAHQKMGMVHRPTAGLDPWPTHSRYRTYDELEWGGNGRDAFSIRRAITLAPPADLYPQLARATGLPKSRGG